MDPHIIAPVPASISLSFVVIAPQLIDPFTPISRLPAVTSSATTEVATMFPVIRDASIFPTTVSQVTVLQDTLPDPALIFLLFVVIAPQLIVPLTPMFKFPAVTFPAGTDVATILPTICDASISQLTEVHVIAPQLIVPFTPISRLPAVTSSATTEVATMFPTI